MGTVAMPTNIGNSSTSSGYEDVIMHPYIEIPILVLIITIGVFGNIFIIGAALVEKQLRNMGVAFIINLAMADLIVTAWYLPILLSNVASGYINVLADVRWLCYVTGFLSSWCCEASMLTLMFIAFNRYWKVTRPNSHQRWFGKKQTLCMICFIWIECFLVALPLIVGWFGSDPLIRFDTQMVSCMWNDSLAPGYNIFLVTTAIFLPVVATSYFYAAIYSRVRKTRAPSREVASPSGKGLERHKTRPSQSIPEVSSCTDDCSTSGVTGNVRSHHARHNSINSHKTARSRKAEERERNLMLTLVVVVVFFVVFWTPYAIIVLTATQASTLAKRACGWLALSNSAVNSIIYGVLNRHFRRGYGTLAKHLGSTLCCCCWKNFEPVVIELGRICRSDRRVPSVKTNSEYKQYSVKFGKS